MFINVLTQVSVLLILITLGFILSKINIINEVGAKCMTDLVLYAVAPSVIILSFIRPFEKSAAKGLAFSLIAAIIAHILFIIVSLLIIRNKDIKRERVLRFAAVFGNCGFMALPLQEVLLGADGVFYGASVVAAFNLIVWSFGIFLMSGDKKYIKPKSLMLSPSIIAILVGIIIFLFSLPVPDIIKSPLRFLAGVNTPLPMIIIGYHLSKSDILKGIKDKGALLSSFLKLVLLPLIALGTMYVCGLRGTILVSLTIALASPAAAMTVMLSAKFNDDTELAATMVSLSHILCILTLPPIIYLAQLIS